jgi:succinylglutamate desuccinylase
MINLYNKIFWIDNTKWVLEIDSWKKWKIFTIVACTHWNEIAWLYVMDYLLNIFEIRKKMKKWKIIFILWNLEAMKKRIRFINYDFNRIWWFEDKYKNSYEYNRALEIKKYIDESDILLDIHSTSLKSDPFFVLTSDYIERWLLKYLRVSFSIENITTFLNWKILARYMSEQKNWNFSLAIEAWSHLSEKTIDLSIINTLNILTYFNFFEWKLIEEKKYDTYLVKECIKSKTLNIKYIYNKKPKSFDIIKKWEILLKDWEEEIIVHSDYLTLMPSYPTYKWEEICYLIKKKEK